jgi:hypothetical protein
LSKSRSCIVLIGPPELLPTLKRSTNDSEVLTFSEADALRALEVISRRRPDSIIVEQTFAKTPRGAALINRVKADPTLTHSVIRIEGPEPGEVTTAPVPAASEETAGGPAAGPPAPLDQRGTRRRPRYRLAGQVEIVTDGNVATVVDLSTIGAQIVSGVILRPNQKLRVSLTDDKATIRFSAIVAWASFEIPPKSGPRYRAGLEFVDADAEVLESFCQRHKA